MKIIVELTPKQVATIMHALDVCGQDANRKDILRDIANAEQAMHREVARGKTKGRL